MKRKKLITKKLTKVVAFAMAAILAMTPMAAQAGEITERTGIFGTDISEYVDSDDYSNSEEEAQTVHDNSEDVAKYESAAAAAETAAVQASEAVDELETQIAIAETEIAKANEAVASVETEATNVSNAATTVSNETTKVGNTTRDVLDHNNKVDVAQDLIERATEEVNAATQVEVEDETEETLVDESIAGESIPAEIGESLAEETIEGETGTEEGTEETVETVDLVTYTADQAAKAQQAAADAETALRNAIAVDTTDINNDEVAGYVQDAQDAADAAADAADAAEDAIDDAVRELMTTIEAYNAAAEKIHLSTISYDFEKGAFVLKDGTLVTEVS
ncbi:MAG: hypothetical protein K6G23_05695, partial [Lachnospiraceae bacterium]|nr:hypothetical protein [Lachnospiraceae bacterium]